MVMDFNRTIVDRAILFKFSTFFVTKYKDEKL